MIGGAPLEQWAMNKEPHFEKGTRAPHLLQAPGVTELLMGVSNTQNKPGATRNGQVIGQYPWLGFILVKVIAFIGWAAYSRSGIDPND